MGQKIKRKITNVEEFCNHMEIEITGTRKKQFSFFDSEVQVEGYKVVNKFVIETDYYFTCRKELRRIYYDWLCKYYLMFVTQDAALH